MTRQQLWYAQWSNLHDLAVSSVSSEYLFQVFSLVSVALKHMVLYPRTMSWKKKKKKYSFIDWLKNCLLSNYYVSVL